MESTKMYSFTDKNCGTELILDQPAGEAEAISSYINYSTIGSSRVLTNATQHSPHARKNFESRRQKIRAWIHHLQSTNGSYGYWILAIIHTSYDIIASCTEEYIHDILWLVHDQEARYYLVE